MNRFQKYLQKISGENRLRALSHVNGIDFTSNDYLGMRKHPKLQKTAIKAIENDIALGSGGSRLLRGHSDTFENLEAYAAQQFATQNALYFANGFQANTAVFQALTNRHDTVIYDELLHASMREAIQNSPTNAVRIAHNNIQAFEDALKKAHEKRRTDGMIWLTIESLYSMDGDFAPVEALRALANEYDAYIIIDEAHSTGIYPSTPNPDERTILIHTCGKAIGVAGGLVCASKTIIDMLVNTARVFIYSTAPPPLQALLTHQSLKILASEEGDQKRADLKSMIDFMGAQSQIIPIIIGANDDAVYAANQLQQNGYDVRAIRPPTVPQDTARLRITLSTNIDMHILKEFKSCLYNIAGKRDAA